jgi:glycosyltransferase involved in cell wall biosynthesis
MNKLSVVLAVRNEEKNISPCLESVKNIADEIIIMDENSTDKTRQIAEGLGAKVYEVNHEPIFHITKQKGMDKATGDWILQLDADERVSPELAEDIKLVLAGNYYKKPKELFIRHQRLVEGRSETPLRPTRRNYAGQAFGYFIPRLNMFLGKPLIHAGVYPDGVIRLVKNGRAHFPQKSVHEQMQIDGAVSWLSGDLIHEDSPTLKRYFQRLNRYTDLQAAELSEKRIPKNALFILHYSLFKPISVFISLFFVHKGFLDGFRGFLWSLFSSWHFPVAYFKYWTNSK